MASFSLSRSAIARSRVLFSSPASASAASQSRLVGRFASFIVIGCVGFDGGQGGRGRRHSGNRGGSGKKRFTERELLARRRKKQGRAMRSLRALAKHDTYMGITVGENEGLERPKDLYDGTPEAFRDYWSYANEFRAEMKNREKALKRAIYGEKERNPDVRVVDERGRAHGRGTRKTSVASVWAWEDAENAGQFTVNGRPVSEFFNSTKDIDHAIEPLVETAMGLEVQVDCHVHGGGKSGQSGAVRMGVARALLHLDPTLRSQLKAGGFLTRDARYKERKVPGQPKARKKFQWTKR